MYNMPLFTPIYIKIYMCRCKHVCGTSTIVNFLHRIRMRDSVFFPVLSTV